MAAIPFTMTSVESGGLNNYKGRSSSLFLASDVQMMVSGGGGGGRGVSPVHFKKFSGIATGPEKIETN